MNETHEVLKQPDLNKIKEMLDGLYGILDCIKKDLVSENKAEQIHAVLSVSTFCEFIESEDGFIKQIYDKHDSIRAQIEKFKADIH